MAPVNTIIGFDYDPQSIRAAKVSCSGSGSTAKYSLLALDELKGNFAKDDDLAAGLKKIRDKIGIGMSDSINTCVSGKQTYVAQHQFKKLADEEMKTALRFEIRKNLSFEVAGSTIDYQYLPTTEKKSETVPVMVTAVANLLLNRHLRAFEKAGMKPNVVDVFPLAVANAFWASKDEGYAGDGAHVILHIGPDMSTLIIESHSSSFYNRMIYFSAAELFGDKRDESIADRERTRRITALTDEITRSLAFYESNFHNGNFKNIQLLGNYAQEELVGAISAGTGLTVERLNLTGKTGGKVIPGDEGKFDVALALAMR